MDDLSERAAKFFPKAIDWPPPERRRTITAAEMVAPSSKKKAIRDAIQASAAETVAPKKKKDIKTEDVKK